MDTNRVLRGFAFLTFATIGTGGCDVVTAWAMSKLDPTTQEMIARATAPWAATQAPRQGKDQYEATAETAPRPDTSDTIQREHRIGLGGLQ